MPEYPTYIALVTDPSLDNEVIVFTVHERNTAYARRAIIAWYGEQEWPCKGLSIRLVRLRADKDVQFIGHATADREGEVIRALCEEVLDIAHEETADYYAEKLIGLVRAFSIGEKVYTDRQENAESLQERETPQ